MISVYLSTQVNGQQLELKGWASLAGSELTEALRRGEVQIPGSYLWLSLPEIEFFGPQGRRIRPEAGVLEGVRMLVVTGLECTLKPLPQG